MRKARLALVSFLFLGLFSPGGAQTVQSDEGSLVARPFSLRVHLGDALAKSLGVSREALRHRATVKLSQLGIKPTSRASANLSLELRRLSGDGVSIIHLAMSFDVLATAADPLWFGRVRAWSEDTIHPAQGLGHRDVLVAVDEQISSFAVAYLKVNPRLQTSAPSQVRPVETVSWQETPTHRVKIKYRAGKEIGRWQFLKKQ